MARKGRKEWEPSIVMKDVQLMDLAQCLVIVAPEWFARADFQEWRRRSRVATWEEGEGGALEGQDVFLVFEEDLDWHARGMPRDIDNKIMRMIKSIGMEYGVIWIKAV